MRVSCLTLLRGLKFRAVGRMLSLVIWRWNKQGVYWESHNAAWRLIPLRPGVVAVDHWVLGPVGWRSITGYWVRLQSYPDLDKAREHVERFQADVDARMAAA